MHDLPRPPAPTTAPPTPVREPENSGLSQIINGERCSIGRPLPCPVCHRLSVARDRALLLLFALLESPQHQALFAKGHGLCLRHYSRALTLKPPEGIREILTEVQAARLSLLEWELEESLRKDSWTFRPEAAGTERTAWSRAIRRFSGSFPECE
jgi:hypothetical protein